MGSLRTGGDVILASTRVGTLLWLTLFAITMAYVEAALVVHLRSLYYPDAPQSIFPLQLFSHRDLAIELGREAMTIIMILSVARLAAKTFAHRFAAFVYIFGLWDLGYYLWLKVFIDWPQSWIEWDVLFLIPWPWLGPWLAPVAIALLFCLWGGYVFVTTSKLFFTKRWISLFLLGAVLALFAFLAPAMPLITSGEEAFRGYQPTSFPWLLFVIGFMLMVISLVGALHQK